MTARSGLFVAPDASGNGTAPVDARRALAGLIGTAARRISGGTLTQSSSNMNVTVAAGVWQLPDSSDVAATFLAATDQTVLTPAAGPASGSRIDSIVVKQNNVENGDSDSRVNVTLIPGTAASSPTPPTIPAGYFEYARVTVPTGVSTASASTVTVMNSSALAARNISAAAAGDLPGIPGTSFGQRAVVGTDEYRWNGTTWQLWSSGWKNFTPTMTGFTIGNGSWPAAQYRFVDGLVHLIADFAFGSTTAIGTAPAITLPVAQFNTYGVWTGQYTIGGIYYDAYIHHGTGGVRLESKVVSGTALRLNAVTSTVPATWAAGDRFELHGFYRVYP